MMSASNPANIITVLIVDDHAVVRQGSRELLASNPHEGGEDIHVIGDIESGETLIETISQKRPDVVLLDINLPGKNGLELLQDIREHYPRQKVILFTSHTDLQYIRRGILLKANGYLSKTATAEELRAAIRVVARGENEDPIYSSDVSAIVAGGFMADAPKLTAREHEILLQVAQGKTNKDIANMLVLSVKTVDSHVARLMKKLDVNNRSQLTAYAYEQGLL